MRLILLLAIFITLTGCLQRHRMHQLEQDNKEATRKVNDLIDNSFEKGKMP